MTILTKLCRHGMRGSLLKMIERIHKKLVVARLSFRNVPEYVNPSDDELSAIERDLRKMGVTLNECAPSREDFGAFQQQSWFPADYHGGPSSGVWDEKLMEHWLASVILGLDRYSPQDVYVDVAAATSPWAKTLRERKNISAFAIDLSEIGSDFKNLPYYRIENATATSFADESVKGVSLHCAYELFLGDDDTKLVWELARILKPGGKAVILPLYMHTHYCAYSTPDYFGKGFCDPGAKEYVRFDLTGIPSSRKYDVAKLKERVLDHIQAAGLRYQLYVLRNKETYGQGIYCHFILEIEKCVKT
jgi:hypothetical protein